MIALHDFGHQPWSLTENRLHIVRCRHVAWNEIVGWLLLLLPVLLLKQPLLLDALPLLLLLILLTFKIFHLQLLASAFAAAGSAVGQSEASAPAIGAAAEPAAAAGSVLAAAGEVVLLAGHEQPAVRPPEEVGLVAARPLVEAAPVKERSLSICASDNWRLRDVTERLMRP